MNTPARLFHPSRRCVARFLYLLRLEFSRVLGPCPLSEMERQITRPADWHPRLLSVVHSALNAAHKPVLSRCFLLVCFFPLLFVFSLLTTIMAANLGRLLGPLASTSAPFPSSSPPLFLSPLPRSVPSRSPLLATLQPPLCRYLPLAGP